MSDDDVPRLAQAALEAARDSDVRLDRVTGGRDRTVTEWQLARAHLLGLADAIPDDLEITLAAGLVAIGVGRSWATDLVRARARERGGD